MKALLLSLAACLMLPGVCLAADKLYLTRMLQLDFNAPGKITLVGVSGVKPVSEETRLNTWIVVIPKRISLAVSITGDNSKEHHYHIGIRIKDELGLAQKSEGFMTPDDLTKMFWLDRYRFQVTMITKYAGPRRKFASATIKVDVYTLEAKEKPEPEPEPKPE